MDNRPIAALDVGSNTIHLVVVRPTPDGRDLITLADQLDLTRLGADVNANGSIGAERMGRALNVLRAQAAMAQSLNVSELLAVATEGVRAAANADEFLTKVQDETGITLRLVSGDQEAALTYWGTTSGLPITNERLAVLDLGGGSMEVVIGEGTHILWRTSLPLGSGAMHDHHAPSDPPKSDELEQVRAKTTGTLAEMNIPLPVTRVIACGGTATTLAALAARALHIAEPEELAVGEESPPPGTQSLGETRLGQLSSEQLQGLTMLLSKTPSALLTSQFGIDSSRAKLLGAGEAVLGAAVAYLGASTLSISRRGIREGAIVARLRAGERWLDAATDGKGWDE